MGWGGWRLGVGAGCAVYTVYVPILLAPGAVLIKCSNFQRPLLARSISDPSVLATRGAYVFIFSFCCLLSVCNVFTTRTLMSIYKVYSIGRNWSWSVMSAPACFFKFLPQDTTPTLLRAYMNPQY